MMKNQVTQEKIAQRLKVSRITVSKALRDHPDISAQMKEKVLKTAADMGYSPNLIASQLSLGKTFTLGIVIPDLENSFFSYLVDSIVDAANVRSYNILLTVSRENQGIEEKNIRNLIGMRVDGLLVCVSQYTCKPDIFRYAGKVGVPLVFFDRFMNEKGFSYVTFNDKQGTFDAIEKLAGAGYRRVAHFAGYQSISIGRERCNSFKNAMKKHGLDIEKKWIIEGGYETKDGYTAFGKLKLSGQMPEVILAVNDRVALGLIRLQKSRV
jgi:LacI family transcriptional regulator